MFRPPERGMSAYSPASPKAWLTAPMRAQRRERSCILHQHRGDCEENRKKKRKKVITLFDLVFADQSKQDTIQDILSELLAFV